MGCHRYEHHPAFQSLAWISPSPIQYNILKSSLPTILNKNAKQSKVKKKYLGFLTFFPSYSSLSIQYTSGFAKSSKRFPTILSLTTKEKKKRARISRSLHMFHSNLYCTFSTVAPGITRKGNLHILRRNFRRTYPIFENTHGFHIGSLIYCILPGFSHFRKDE
ncbi:hypothetical protein EYC80_005877 [Monilinia laxa]|uniref:Uncharacterized protein n=1 Tax=Monilinia laxa TaxID=61186 RepID=A0A5N6KFV5_MONLA|nr:hypothetical protein EYC80_005877 [Monilinia laxa]